MGTISVRFKKDEDNLIRKYAKLHNTDLSSFIREAVIEKIENEYDLRLFKKVWEDEKNKEKINHMELKKELGL